MIEESTEEMIEESTEELTLGQKIVRLNRLAMEIDDAKSERDKRIGERDSILMNLRTQHGIKDIAAARKKILALDQQINTRNRRIDQGFVELSKKYEL